MYALASLVDVGGASHAWDLAHRCSPHDPQVREVTREAQYIFDAYLPGFQDGDSFTVLHSTQESPPSTSHAPSSSLYPFHLAIALSIIVLRPPSLFFAPSRFLA